MLAIIASAVIHNNVHMLSELVSLRKMLLRSCKCTGKAPIAKPKMVPNVVMRIG